jgi:hypothetical protein
MKTVPWLLFAVAGSLPFGGHAEFSWELAGGGGVADRDGAGAELDSQFAGVSATYYFAPVDDGSGPHALAGFLDPSTQISISGREDRQTLTTTIVGTAPSNPSTIAGGVAFDPVFERHMTDYSIAGHYLLPRSKWYAGGRLALGDVDEPRASPVTGRSTEVRSRGLVAGKYFGTGATRLEVGLARSSSESEIVVDYCPVLVACLRGSVSSEAIEDTIHIDVMHVRRFRSATFSLFGSVGELDRQLRLGAPVFTATPSRLPALLGLIVGNVVPMPVQILPVTELDLEPTHTYSVGTEIFPVPAVGVRLGYSRLDAETADDDAIAIGASWFFRRNVGLEFTLSRDDPEGDVPRTERAALRLIGRL